MRKTAVVSKVEDESQSMPEAIGTTEEHELGFSLAETQKSNLCWRDPCRQCGSAKLIAVDGNGTKIKDCSPCSKYCCECTRSEDCKWDPLRGDEGRCVNRDEMSWGDDKRSMSRDDLEKERLKSEEDKQEEVERKEKLDEMARVADAEERRLEVEKETRERFARHQQEIHDEKREAIEKRDAAWEKKQNANLEPDTSASASASDSSESDGSEQGSAAGPIGPGSAAAPLAIGLTIFLTVS